MLIIYISDSKMKNQKRHVTLYFPTASLLLHFSFLRQRKQTTQAQGVEVKISVFAT